MYYARLEIRSLNGVMTGSDLQLLPAGKEFRHESFRTYRVIGQAPAEEGNVNQAARHNAVQVLLHREGLQSVISRGGTANGQVHDEVRVRYEGAVIYPIEILSRSYTTDQASFRLEANIRFSPIAFPDRWSYLYMKDRISRFFKDLGDWFW